jgi:hypothetical protein
MDEQNVEIDDSANEGTSVDTLPTPNQTEPAVCPTCQQPLPPRSPRIFVYEEARAIQAMLVERLNDERGWQSLESAILGTEVSAPKRTGVYRLRYKGHPIYAGKAKSNLMDRLRSHYRHMGGRHGLDRSLAECTFVVLPPPWDVRTNEEGIIVHYRAIGEAPWNVDLYGFGSNDPGRNRDRTEPSRYHQDHPARRDFQVTVGAGNYTVEGILKVVKRQTPYLVRYQTKRLGDEPDWEVGLARHIDWELDYSGSIERFLIELCRSHLQEWQLTYLPLGYILYKEKYDYEHGAVLYQRP